VSDRYVMRVEVTQFPWLRSKYEDLGARYETAPPFDCLNRQTCASAQRSEQLPCVCDNYRY